MMVTRSSFDDRTSSRLLSFLLYKVDQEALRRFDELWDDVPSPRNAQQPADASVEPALLTRLPPSGSLVAIESKTDPANNIRGKRLFKKMLEKVLQCLE